MTTLLGIFSVYMAQYFLAGLAWLAGTILALTTWRQHPKVSRYTLMAFAIFFVESALSVFAGLYAPLMMRDRGWTIGAIQIWMFLQNGLFSLMSAAAWVLILAAIFGRRDEQ